MLAEATKDLAVWRRVSCVLGYIDGCEPRLQLQHGPRRGRADVSRTSPLPFEALRRQPKLVAGQVF